MFAASAPPADAQPRTARVDVGLFVASVYDLNFYDQTFKSNFWVWFLYDDPLYDPVAGIEITNAREYEVLEKYGRQREDGRYYVAAKFVAVINQPWDITDFPFDAQRLNIVIESVGKDSSLLEFGVDAENSVITPDLGLSGWHHLPLEAERQVFHYNTNFGEEAAGDLSFPRVQFTVPLRRSNPKLYFEVYIGYMIAFLMCSAILLTKPSGMPDYRIGMILAATFAAIGNKNVLESNYPSSPNIGLADQIEIATFALITLCMVIAVGAERLHLDGRDDLAAKSNRYALPFVLIVYAAFIGYCTVSAAAAK